MFELDDATLLDMAEHIQSANAEAKLAEEKRQRIERFTQFFGRVNSAFTFRKVTVTVENSSMGAPAWSGASNVVFNSRQIGELDDARSIAGIKGLDLHEISHILYTSREGSELFDFVRENEYFTAYNALEDSRIEFLFTSKYPSTIDWFTSTILIHFVDNEESFINSYPLLCGRRYLPLELRARSRNIYPHQELVSDISEVVNAYRNLLFPIDTDKGKELIARFHDLIAQTQSGEGSGEGAEGSGEGSGTRRIRIRLNDPFGHGKRPSEGLESSPSSRPVPTRKQEKDMERAQNNDSIDESELADALKNDVDIDIEIDFDDATDSDTDSDSGSDSNIDTDADSDSSDESGSGAGDSDAEKIDALINDILENVLAKNADEINDIIHQLGGLTSLSTNTSKEPELDSFNLKSPDANTFHASLKFSRELERIKALNDPAWDKYESQGRIDAHRYLRGDELDTIFDQWNEGREDATEIECVIALDNSGSMQGVKANNAYKAMYAIKRALDRIDANCTVLTFNNLTHTLYRSTDRAGGVIRDAGSGGGTEPTDAIKYATKVLAETSKPVRIFIAITDGDWSGDQKANHEAIEQLSRAGVLTAFAFIPEAEQTVTLNRETAHHCEIASVVRDPIDLIGMVRSIVKYGIGRRLISN